MKIRTTQKAVKAAHEYVIRIPYCAMQYALSCETPAAYTARREGWGADVYSVGGYSISTGYAPFGNVKPSRDLIRRYEYEAREICELTPDFNRRHKFLHDLLMDFAIDAVLETYSGSIFQSEVDT